LGLFSLPVALRGCIGVTAVVFLKLRFYFVEPCLISVSKCHICQSWDKSDSQSSETNRTVTSACVLDGGDVSTLRTTVSRRY